MSGYVITPSFCHDAPNKFLQNAEKINSTQVPETLTTGSVYDDLSKDMFEKYLDNKQTVEVFRIKMNLWNRLNDNLKTHFPSHGIHMTGSSINGFGTKSGDVDLSLIVKDLPTSNRKEAINGLSKYHELLKKDQNLDEMEFIIPTVPLILCRDKVYDLKLNVSYNNTINLRNTHLLYYYSQVDWRVRPLVSIVKSWAAFHNINEARYQTISSYSLVLMVIHFLQCGTRIAVVPNLQSLYVNKFRIYSDVESLDYFENLQSTETCKNNQTLGELFIDFLKYYTFFDYENYVISIRLGKKIPFSEFKKEKSYMTEPYRWNYLKIEEPYTLDNTARSVHKYPAFLKIKKVFSESYKKIYESRKLSSVFERLV